LLISFSIIYIERVEMIPFSEADDIPFKISRH
jgi:hypothetical protein